MKKLIRIINKIILKMINSKKMKLKTNKLFKIKNKNRIFSDKWGLILKKYLKFILIIIKLEKKIKIQYT